MGIFSKISENLHHGGIKLSLAAPDTVSMKDAEIPVTVTLTASEAHTISNVRVDLMASQQNIGFQQGVDQQPGSVQNRQPTEVLVARGVSGEVFTMAVGDTKEVAVSISLNAGAAAVQANLSPAEQAIAKSLASLQNMDNALNKNQYTYSLKAVAKVEGLALSPSAHRPIQVNKPGEFGSMKVVQL